MLNPSRLAGSSDDPPQFPHDPASGTPRASDPCTRLFPGASVSREGFGRTQAFLQIHRPVDLQERRGRTPEAPRPLLQAVVRSNPGGRRSADCDGLRGPVVVDVPTAVGPTDRKNLPYVVIRSHGSDTRSVQGGGPIRRPQSTVEQKGGSSICSTEGEVGMPTARGSVIFSELIDCHGESLKCLLDAVEDVTSDGIVEPHERNLLKNVMVLATRTYQPLPVGAAEQDDAFRAIGAIAGAGKVSSRHVSSLISQAGADAERRIA